MILAEEVRKSIVHFSVNYTPSRIMMYRSNISYKEVTDFFMTVINNPEKVVLYSKSTNTAVFHFAKYILENKNITWDQWNNKRYSEI